MSEPLPDGIHPAHRCAIPPQVIALIDEATPEGHPGRDAMIRDLNAFYARGGWRDHLATAVGHILRGTAERPAGRAA